MPQCSVVLQHGERAEVGGRLTILRQFCPVSGCSTEYSTVQYSATVLLPAAHYFSNFPDSENCTNNEMKVGQQQQQQAGARPSNVSCKPNHFRSSVSTAGCWQRPRLVSGGRNITFYLRQYVVATVDIIGSGSYPTHQYSVSQY